MKLKQNPKIKKVDFYDLEDKITSVWVGIDDIEILFQRFYEYHEEMTVDEVANALLGIHKMLDFKCNILFETYESLLKEMRNESRNATPFGEGITSYEGSN
jgi:hypothetical protein